MGFVYVRKMHCPTCKTKNALVNQPDELEKTKTRKCECGCGSDVIAPSRFKSGHNNPRNPEMEYRDGRAYGKAICSHCNAVFAKRQDQINRRSNRNYCSPKCANEANGIRAKGRTLPSKRNGGDVTCAVCEKQFYVSGYRLKMQAKFCSRQCQGKWQQDRPVPKGFITGADNRGEKNGRYKHGKRIGTNTTKPKVRKAVMERDGNWCLTCGKPGPGLHLHRVVYGSQGGKYEVTNCVLLCNVHHEEIHSNKKKWAPILLAHLSRQRVV